MKLWTHILHMHAITSSILLPFIQIYASWKPQQNQWPTLSERNNQRYNRNACHILRICHMKQFFFFSKAYSWKTNHWTLIPYWCEFEPSLGCMRGNECFLHYGQVKFSLCKWPHNFEENTWSWAISKTYLALFYQFRQETLALSVFQRPNSLTLQVLNKDGPISFMKDAVRSGCMCAQAGLAVHWSLMTEGSFCCYCFCFYIHICSF